MRLLKPCLASRSADLSRKYHAVLQAAWFIFHKQHAVYIQHGLYSIKCISGNKIYSVGSAGRVLHLDFNPIRTAPLALQYSICALTQEEEKGGGFLSCRSESQKSQNWKKAVLSGLLLPFPSVAQHIYKSLPLTQLLPCCCKTTHPRL